MKFSPSSIIMKSTPRWFVTPAVSLLFLVMCSAAPISFATVYGQIGSVHKNALFYEGLTILAVLVITIVVLALIVRKLNNVQKHK